MPAFGGCGIFFAKLLKSALENSAARIGGCNGSPRVPRIICFCSTRTPATPRLFIMAMECGADGQIARIDLPLIFSHGQCYTCWQLSSMLKL